MRSLLFILAVLTIASCKKDPAPQAKSTSASIYNPQWITNWYHNDTLIGVIIDTMGSSNGYDTVYTAKYGDTSCIWYEGVKYYVWGSDFFNDIREVVDTFDANDHIHIYTYIGSVPFDTLQGIMDHGRGSSIFPYKYLHEDGITWQHRKQTILLHSTLNFKYVAGNQYRSNRTY